ncbi:MAG: hypothetical protein CMO01_19465 [Thalassobius sp.]|nr:hypothetical protein [Thalassovita sp.]
MRFFSISIFLILSVYGVHAQKYGYFDSRVVIQSLSEYKDAQKELDKFAETWKNELDQKYKALEELQSAYASKEILLKPSDRQKQLQSIYDLESEIEEYRQSKFGYEGALYLKRQALIEPIQEKIFDGVSTVCRKNRLEFLFDKASSIVIIYSDPIHNYTKLITAELEPKEEEGEEQQYGQKEEVEPEPAEYAGYINSDYVLKKMPEYQDVLNELENFEGMWKHNFDSLNLQLDSLNDAFKKDEVYLTSEMKDIRVKEIDKKKEEVRKFQVDKYGPEGEVFTKRLELLKPLQDKIYESTEKVAQEKNVHFIFDKTDDHSMFYVNPIYNYSDYVLENMGLGEQEDIVR